MDDLLQWVTLIRADVVQLFQQVVGYLPRLIGGVALILVGWLVARLLRSFMKQAFGGWDWLIQKLLISKLVSDAETRQTWIVLVSNGVYWLTIFFFITAAANTLNLELFSTWLNRVVLYIPTIISGAIVTLFGFVLGAYARDVIQRRLTGATRPQRMLLANTARFTIILTGLVVGLDLVGIDTSVLVTVIGIGLAVITGGSALAFGLGARTLVSNLIGARQVRRQCQVGDRIRIAGIEGRVLSLGSSSVTLETREGRTMVPGKLFAEESSVVLQGELRHD